MEEINIEIKRSAAEKAVRAKSKTKKPPPSEDNKQKGKSAGSILDKVIYASGYAAGKALKLKDPYRWRKLTRTARKTVRVTRDKAFEVVDGLKENVEAIGGAFKEGYEAEETKEAKQEVRQEVRQEAPKVQEEKTDAKPQASFARSGRRGKAHLNPDMEIEINNIDNELSMLTPEKKDADE